MWRDIPEKSRDIKPTTKHPFWVMPASPLHHYLFSAIVKKISAGIPASHTLPSAIAYIQTYVVIVTCREYWGIGDWKVPGSQTQSWRNLRGLGIGEISGSNSWGYPTRGENGRIKALLEKTAASLQGVYAWTSFHCNFSPDGGDRLLRAAAPNN